MATEKLYTYPSERYEVVVNETVTYSSKNGSNTTFSNQLSANESYTDNSINETDVEFNSATYAFTTDLNNSKDNEQKANITVNQSDLLTLSTATVSKISPPANLSIVERQNPTTNFQHFTTQDSGGISNNNQMIPEKNKTNGISSVTNLYNNISNDTVGYNKTNKMITNQPLIPSDESSTQMTSMYTPDMEKISTLVYSTTVKSGNTVVTSNPGIQIKTKETFQRTATTKTINTPAYMYDKISATKDARISTENIARSTNTTLTTAESVRQNNVKSTKSKNTIHNTTQRKISTDMMHISTRPTKDERVSKSLTKQLIKSSTVKSTNPVTADSAISTTQQIQIDKVMVTSVNTNSGFSIDELHSLDSNKKNVNGSEIFISSKRIKLRRLGDKEDDRYWPAAVAVTVGVPAIIIIGVTIIVMHRKRLGRRHLSRQNKLASA